MERTRHTDRPQVFKVGGSTFSTDPQARPPDLVLSVKPRGRLPRVIFTRAAKVTAELKASLGPRDEVFVVDDPNEGAEYLGDFLECPAMQEAMLRLERVRLGPFGIELGRILDETLLERLTRLFGYRFRFRQPGSGRPTPALVGATREAEDAGISLREYAQNLLRAGVWQAMNDSGEPQYWRRGRKYLKSNSGRKREPRREIVPLSDLWGDSLLAWLATRAKRHAKEAAVQACPDPPQTPSGGTGLDAMVATELLLQEMRGLARMLERGQIRAPRRERELIRLFARYGSWPLVEAEMGISSSTRRQYVFRLNKRRIAGAAA